jgi:hypothetical protein
MIIRKYSVTADVLSYKRCRRQYGFFAVRGLRSASATQRYFGTLIHDVLDQMFRDYKNTKQLPNVQAIQTYVEQAHLRLIQSGIKALNTAVQKETITNILDRFVDLIGTPFFSNVQETEYPLERSMNHNQLQFVLHGTVDVMSGAIAHQIGLNYATSPSDVEIWDYKSGHMPSANLLSDYEYQMKVYAELYRQQTGSFPARCVLVFLGELAKDKVYEDCKKDIRNLQKILITLHPTTSNVQPAVDDFVHTVTIIENEKIQPYHKQWDEPNHPVDPDTCAVCELRYQCSKFPHHATQRKEPL